MNEMKITNLLKTAMVALVLTAGLASTVFAERAGKEKKKTEKVSWNDLPAAVQSTISDKAAGARVGQIERKSKKGTIAYEVTVTAVDGKATDLKVAADGKLLKSRPADNNENKQKGKQDDSAGDDDKDEKK